MQPNPRAETSRLLFPSLRFCITSPFRAGVRLRHCVCTLLLAPASGWNPFPRAESTNEGVCVLISEKIGSFVQLEDGVVEIVASKLVTRFLQNTLEAGSCVLQAPLE